MVVGCPFITCAVKRRGISFCWECEEADTCDRWREHRAYGREHDTFVCYQRLEQNIALARRHGASAFDDAERVKEQVLKRLLEGFDEGRSRRYFCVAATVFAAEELTAAIEVAESRSSGLDTKARARIMRSVLQAEAARLGYTLGLRK